MCGSGHSRIYSQSGAHVLRFAAQPGCRARGAGAAGVRANAVTRDGAGCHAARGDGQDDGAAGQGHARGDEGAEPLTTAGSVQRS